MAETYGLAGLAHKLRDMMNDINAVLAEAQVAPPVNYPAEIKALKAEFNRERDRWQKRNDELVAAAKMPNLGFVTTRQLLAELAARAEDGGYADYRTVDPDAAPVVATVDSRPVVPQGFGQGIPWNGIARPGRD